MEEKTLWGYKGKVCVVTGSSNGMGLAVARLLVQLGAEVYAVSAKQTLKVLPETFSVIFPTKRQLMKHLRRFPKRSTPFSA